MLFHVWRSSGADPYRLYNNLDAEYRPIHDASMAPRPPRFPERVRAFIYACGMAGREVEAADRMQLARMIGRAVGG